MVVDGETYLARYVPSDAFGGKVVTVRLLVGQYPLDGGVDVGALAFEASHGRTALEYYDGFVFSFHQGEPLTGGALAADDLPAVASGGRYDALTAILGAGRSIPAVGGIIRPALVAQMKGLPA